MVDPKLINAFYRTAAKNHDGVWRGEEGGRGRETSGGGLEREMHRRIGDLHCRRWALRFIN